MAKKALNTKQVLGLALGALGAVVVVLTLFDALFNWEVFPPIMFILAIVAVALCLIFIRKK